MIWGFLHRFYTILEESESYIKTGMAGNGKVLSLLTVLPAPLLALFVLVPALLRILPAPLPAPIFMENEVPAPLPALFAVLPAPCCHFLFICIFRYGKIQALGKDLACR